MASSSDTSNWIGDGSKGGKLDVLATDGGGATIAFASSTRGTPFNVRLNADPMENSYYEVKVRDLAEGSSLGVGLVAGDGFRPGWRTSGCFYNGNVIDGSAGLVIGFGPTIGTGDVVGVCERRRSGDNGVGRRDVIFHHNGRCLGTGFSLECDEDERLYPCLHLSGSAAVEYSVPSLPSSFEREGGAVGPGDPYGGEWAIERALSTSTREPALGGRGGRGIRDVLTRATRPSSTQPPAPDPCQSPELVELTIPEGEVLTVSFEREGTGYSISAKIDNSLWSSLTITGEAEAFDEIQLGGCASTRMMPSPHLGEMEDFMGSALGEGRFKKIRVTDEGKLIMTGPTAEVICSRHVATFEPVMCSYSGGKIVVH